VLRGLLGRQEKPAIEGSAPVPILPNWGRATQAGALLLGASVAGAALAVGTVHTVTLCVVTAALAVAAALTWAGADATNMRTAATLLLVTAVGLTGYTALQLVPIPLGLMRLIAPRNAETWSNVLEATHEAGPSWASLSLDPSATRVELLKGVAYLLAFVTSLRLVRRRGGVSFLSAVLVLTGVALALAAVLHPAFGAEKLYGFIEPEAHVEARHMAPFLNPNNLAGYLNIAFCIAFAAAISPDPRFPRSLSASVALLLAATQIWVASRGGVGAMVVGAIAVVIVSRVAARGPGGRSLAIPLALITALGVGAALIGFGSSSDVAPELLTTDARFKFELFRDALRMIPAYPIFGTGRGAFETTFPAFRESIWVTTFSHPENVVLQWAIEWGLPIAIAAFVAVAFALRPRTVLARPTTAAGPWAAIVAVATQNMVDLGTEIPGLMLAVVVCAAMVAGGTAGRQATWRVEAWGRAPAMVVATAIAAACVTVVAAFLGIENEVDADRMALFAAAKEPTTTAEEMRSGARDAMLRHPGEPYLPFIAGWRAERARDDDAMPWLEATLERARVYPTAHVALANLLARRSPAQARLEYRIALEQDPVQLWTIVPDMVRLVGGYDDAMELVPRDKTSAHVLELMVERLGARLPATRVRLDAEIVSRDPRASAPAVPTATGAVEDVENADEPPWCEGASRAACIARAIDVSNQAETLDAQSCEPHALRARAEAAAGNADKGLANLASTVDRVHDRIPCLEQLARLADAAHDEPRWRAAVEKVASAGCGSDAECATNLSWAAAQQEAHGKFGEALPLYKRAYERMPGDDTLLEQVAKLAAQAGLHTESAEAYERLAHKQPSDPRWKHAADAQRSAL
jgi:tetratricopeptide (TPR) repeat protein